MYEFHELLYFQISMGKTKFQPSWVNEFQRVAPLKGDTSKAYCTICKKAFRTDGSGKSQVSSHHKSDSIKDDCNGTRTHNHLVRKRILNHLAKLVPHKETQRDSSLCFQIVQLLKVMLMQMLIVQSSIWHYPILQITTCQERPFYLQVRWGH